MKSKFFKSLRVKLVINVVISGITGLVAANLLLLLGQRYYTRPLIHDLLWFFSSKIGVQPMVYIAAFIFFVLMITISTRKSIKYLDAIIAGIRKMEQGDLNARVDVRTGDELGVLAEAVNSMAGKLAHSIEEERKSEEAKKELITSVSHDLRTPLTSVIGFLGLLKERGGQKEEDLERYASIAHKKALRLKELIDDLFEYTRVSYSGIRVEAALLDIQELLRQLAEEYFPVFAEQEITLNQYYSNEKLMITGDGELIMRLFENLIQNAVRYGKEGKVIDIRISRNDASAVVGIINHGNPIPEEKLPYIFERFYRAEESRSRETGGSGLGLAIAKNIAELHHGRISARSGACETCFEVVLPLAGQEGLHVQN